MERGGSGGEREWWRVREEEGGGGGMEGGRMEGGERRGIEGESVVWSEGPGLDVTHVHSWVLAVVHELW